MKKIIFLFLSTITLISCEKSVEFNNPAFQGLIDNSLWKATDFSATKSTSGAITIRGNANIAENFEFKLSSTTLGTRLLGTTNFSNYFSYTSASATSNFNYTTGITSSPANKIILLAGGTGYTTSNLVLTTGGSGSGLKVNIVANANGVVTSVMVNAPGINYKAGDVVSIATGNADAKFIVQNVTNSNGEITITEYDGATISGNFKVTAYDAVNKKTITCRDGIFYKIPVN